MLLKDIDFNAIDEAGGFNQPTAGAYCCKIVNVVNVPDKQYLKLSLDIVEGTYKDYGKQTAEKTGKDFGYMTAYLSYKPTALPMLKGLLHVICDSERDNFNRFLQQFADTDGMMLRGKKVGAVVGLKEYRKKNGTIGKAFDLPSLVDYNEVKKNPEQYAIPELKKLQAEAVSYTVSSADVLTEDVPF